MQHDPNSAENDPSRGITPPQTTMKARTQRERAIQGLILPVVVLLVFAAFIVKPAIDGISRATAKPAPSATPYPYPTATSSPDSGDIEHLLSQQANGAVQTAAERAAALRKIGFTPPASPTPSANDAARTAAAAASLKKSYDDLNTTNGPGSPAQSGPYGYNLVTGYNQGTPPTPPPVVTPAPPSARIPQGLEVTVVTPPPTAAPKPVAQVATPAPTGGQNGNPYNNGGVFVPGPSGINYVGVEPGQNSGVTPQTMGQMRVANQAQFLTSGPGAVYSNAQESPALSYDEIFPSRKIHWVPDVDIVSSLPGTFTGHVTEDVVSNLPIPCGNDVCAHELLIPNGTTIQGTYNADVQGGADRIQCHITLLIFPNGNTLPLTDTQASDLGGANGVKASVDNHVGKIYTVTLIGALINGIGNAVALRASLANPIALGPAVAQGFGNSLAETASQAAQKQLQQPPTLTVKAGTLQTFSFSQIQLLAPYRKTQNASRE